LQIDIKNILFIVLICAIIILAYRLFVVEVNTSSYDKLIDKLEAEKTEILKAIHEKDENIAEIFRLIQEKDTEIKRKEREISRLKKIINEKADSVYRLDNKDTYKLLSDWLSENYK